MDIVTVLQSLEIKDIPSFVVRDLANVPPLTSLNCDVIGLYREIEKLKDGFSVVKQCQENIATLSKQMELQRTPNSAPNDHDHSIIHSTPNHIPARETRDSATTMNINMSTTKNTATPVHGSGNNRESVTPRGNNANLLDGSYVVIDSVPRSGSDSDTSEGESENEESITQAQELRNKVAMQTQLIQTLLLHRFRTSQDNPITLDLSVHSVAGRKSKQIMESHRQTGIRRVVGPHKEVPIQRLLTTNHPYNQTGKAHRAKRTAVLLPQKQRVQQGKISKLSVLKAQQRISKQQNSQSPFIMRALIALL